MKKTTLLLPLFEQFIKDTESGKRLKKDGSKISKASVDNYWYLYRNLRRFSEKTGMVLRIVDASKLTKRELLVEKNYWKKFYRRFTSFLYSRGCYDNYVGTNIKHFKTFIRYLKIEKALETGSFYKNFYVRKEDVDILVLSPEQLKFLIHDTKFNQQLTPHEKRVKDIFVFGCSTALRFSDITALTDKNFEKNKGHWYLRLKSKKTKTKSAVKLSNYAVEIFREYSEKNKNKTLFGPISLSGFNWNLKKIGEKANFTYPINVTREKMGTPKKRFKHGSKNEFRFCDKMTSHMMRRTAITTMLILGMPEHLVRNISGHSYNGTSFYRYVHYAQPYLNRELEKVHAQLEQF